MGRTSNTMIFTKKAYTGKSKSEKDFARNVIETSRLANNLNHHIQLLQEIYPNYNITELYTFEHGNMYIERTRSCRFDSSLDGMAAYKDEKELTKKIQNINDYLND